MKRMKGLEPSTFCMARNPLSATRNESTRQSAGLPQLRAQRRTAGPFCVGAESPRAEAVRPFPVPVETVPVVGPPPVRGERGMEVSELPCSTGEHARSVEPVREIAMAERLVVTRPWRVKDGITGIRFWLEIEDLRTYRGPVDVRGIEHAVGARQAGVVVAILVRLENSAARGGGCQWHDRDSYRDHCEHQDRSFHLPASLSGAALDGGPQDL